MIIQEKQVHDAVFKKQTLIPLLGEATEKRVICEESKKAILSTLIRACDKKTHAEREAYAYTQPEYMDWVKRYAAAIREEQGIKLNISYVDTVIDVWRTEGANARKS